MWQFYGRHKNFIDLLWSQPSVVNEMCVGFTTYRKSAENFYWLNTKSNIEVREEIRFINWWVQFIIHIIWCIFFLCRRKNKELYLSRILLSYSYDRIEQLFFINILKVLASYHHLNNNNNNRSHPNCRIIRKYDSVILINVIMRRNFVIHTSGRD